MFSSVAGTYNAIRILKTVGATFEKQMNSFQRQFYLRFAREESQGVSGGRSSEDLGLF